MSVKWSVFDKLIAALRFNNVKNKVPRNSILCDLGCGFNGDFLKAMAPVIIKGYGFDRKVINVTIDNIILHSVNNLENGIPAEDESVDCVTMLAMLEHLDQPDKILQEGSRILKQGGMFILTTPPPISKKLLEFLAFRLKIISEEEIRDHKVYYNRKDIVTLLTKHGYKEIYVRRFMLGFNQLAVGTKS